MSTAKDKGGNNFGDCDGNDGDGDRNVNGRYGACDRGGKCDGVWRGACSDGVVGGGGVILSNQR